MAKKYKVVFGHRRLAACKKLGWKNIPAKIDSESKIKEISIKDIEVVRNSRTQLGDLSDLMNSIKQFTLLQSIGVTTKADDKEFLLVNATENLQRKDISPLELGNICEELRNKYSMSDREIATRLSTNMKLVTSVRRLAKETPTEFSDHIGFMGSGKGVNKDGKISYHTASYVLSARFLKAKDKKELLHSIKKNELSLSIVKQILRTKQRSKGLSVKQLVENTENYDLVHTEFCFNAPLHKKLKKRYGLPTTEMVRQMLQGKIPLEKKLIY